MFSRLNLFDRVMTVLMVGAFGAVLVANVAVLMVSDVTTPAPSVPRCTDLIADAGGICHGEPLPLCETEDSDDCYWDGGRNGLGRSFVTEHGITTFTD